MKEGRIVIQVAAIGFQSIIGETSFNIEIVNKLLDNVMQPQQPLLPVSERILCLSVVG